MKNGWKLPRGVPIRSVLCVAISTLIAVPVLIVAITTIGWFSIDAYLIGDSAHRLFSWMPTILICIRAGIGMTITAS